MLPDCIYLGLGGNMPGTQSALENALRSIADFLEFRSVSSVYCTAPQDYQNQASFLNIVAAFEINKIVTPISILDFILATEKKLGRTREGVIAKGPRIVDIDLLLFGALSWNDEKLLLPHPRMHNRRFVLEPLLELEPLLQDPVSNQPYSQALEACQFQAIYSKTPFRYTHVPI